MSSDLGEWSAGKVPDAWSSLFDENGPGPGIPLGTARWLSPDVAVQKFAYPGALFSGRVWVGEAFDPQANPLGYVDDRHVCLVSGSRGGKGVGVIVPNLSFWPGSAIIVDPKGENATVSARRRGEGSPYAHAMGQKVCILDPFGEVELPAALKARYNPLDAIDPESDFAIDDASRVAASLVVVENRNDPYWEEAARNLIKGLILHVLSAPYLAQHCNLLTVRRLLSQGDWLSLELARNAGDDGEMPSAFEVLWSRMRRNPAFNGVVAGVGEQMISMAEKQRSGVLESARTNTEFLDSTPMQRLLERSDFDLGELKTNARGMTVYLTLPARYMETHYRWLRLMITLAVGEMERIKRRPATGHPTLFLLDEFAGLKRMEVIEHAAAQAAGFGVKFLFVVQNLAQLEDLYQRSWETFLGNSGLKMFFQIDDDFTRSYVSRQLGELETIRQTRSGSQSESTSYSETKGYSSTHNDGGGTTRSPWLGIPKSRQSSWGRATGSSSSTSQGRSGSTTEGWGEAVHKRPLLNPDEIGRMLARVDDRSRPGYPGLLLAFIPGELPLLARRVNYFESPRFLGYFDPHPHHPTPPTLAQLAERAARPEATVLTFQKPPAPLPRMRWGIVGAIIGALAFTAVIINFVNGIQQRQAGTDSPQAARPTVYENASPTPAAPAPATSAYAQGAADWRALRAWFGSQTRDRRAGADWWAANRSQRDHEDCDEAAQDRNGDERDFTAGCLDAKRLLDQVDANRANPQYRAGFNDEAKRSPL